ncbi:hypothetical protein PoB_000728700 [Plakobranchus ocellatus]|uniref:Uncharacterized protein n=1 Tax=Plakobranchus ocellatus TaxID=259542 RepID=A0AAV3YF43_9GAST|nr:hypothetical protein PoB_000728700 [Plakobranchus ocellatus]
MPYHMLFRSRKKPLELVFFLEKAFLINVSSLTKWSNVPRTFLKPHCTFDSRFLDLSTWTSRSFTIRSRVLQKQLLSAIGLYRKGYRVFELEPQKPPSKIGGCLR